jgi:hypothetical protein
MTKAEQFREYAEEAMQWSASPGRGSEKCAYQPRSHMDASSGCE